MNTDGLCIVKNPSTCNKTDLILFEQVKVLTQFREKHLYTKVEENIKIVSIEL